MKTAFCFLALAVLVVYAVDENVEQPPPGNVEQPPPENVEQPAPEVDVAAVTQAAIDALDRSKCAPIPKRSDKRICELKVKNALLGVNKAEAEQKVAELAKQMADDEAATNKAMLQRLQTQLANKQTAQAELEKHIAEANRRLEAVKTDIQAVSNQVDELKKIVPAEEQTPPEEKAPGQEEKAPGPEEVAPGPEEVAPSA